MLLRSYLFAAIFLLTCLAQAQKQCPIHVVIVFDRTASFWRWTNVAHAIVRRLFGELRFTLPSSGNDLITFIELSSKPSIVAQLRGASAWLKGADAFLKHFNQPVPEKGTAIVEALWLVTDVLQTQPEGFDVFLLFSDLHPDPCPPNISSWVKELMRFDWNQLESIDSFWIFLWESDPSFDKRGRPYTTVLRESFAPLRRAHFVPPPPLVDGVLQRRQLDDFVNQIVNDIVDDVASLDKNNEQAFVTSWMVVLATIVGLAFLVLAAVLSRRGAGRHG